MKLALVRQRYNPYGGAERFVERALTALATEDLNVTLVTRKWGGSEAGRQVLICNPFYIGRLWRDWGFAKHVQRLVDSRRFDIVQSHERTPGCHLYRAGDGVHTEWLRQRARVVGRTGRLALRLNPYHVYLRRAERALFTSPSLRAVICISEMTRREIIEHFHVAPHKLRVIYNGIDTAVFHPGLREIHCATVRAELGFSSKDVVALFVGSGFERKGVLPLLQALQMAPPRLRLIVVGHDKRLGEYRRHTHLLGLDDRVRFLGGRPDVRPYYGAADLFVLPTLYEPFGNVILEAMASGLPIIASTMCGGGELIEPGREGFLVDALDVAGIGAALTALDDDTRRRGCAVAARERVEAFTLERMTKELTALYRELLRDNLPCAV
jgi:UDP-glucose:(heptosyl)LPS alpha-1,3-glucosyltransferase